MRYPLGSSFLAHYRFSRLRLRLLTLLESLGVIDLALSCAQEWDVSEKGISYWLDGSPADDSRSTSFELRKKCNELIFESLELMDNLLNQASESNRLISMDSYGRQSSLSRESLSYSILYFMNWKTDFYFPSFDSTRSGWIKN